jgi:hypothetical protein
MAHGQVALIVIPEQGIMDQGLWLLTNQLHRPTAPQRTGYKGAWLVVS